MKFFGPHRPERVLLRRNTLYSEDIICALSVVPEAELNVSVKGQSRALCCKGMLLRENQKNLSAKQLWAQGAIQSYGLSVVTSRECRRRVDSQLDLQGSGHTHEES